MDKLGLTGQDLGRVFNSRSGCFHIMKKMLPPSKTVYLKVENSDQASFRFTSVIYCAMGFTKVLKNAFLLNQ